MRALLLLMVGILGLVSGTLGLSALGWIPSANFFSDSITLATEGWFPLINLRHNAFLHWRLDSALSLVAALLPSSNLRISIALAALLVLFVGVSLLSLRLTKHRAPLPTIAACMGLCLALLSIFGWDAVLFQFLAWIPFLMLCAIACMYGREAFGVFLILVCFFALRIAHSANVLAPLAVLLAIGGASLLFRGMLADANKALLSVSKGSPPLVLPPQFLRISAILVAGCLFIAAFPVLQSPSVNGQMYPWQSHVVTEDWISGNVHPLLGPGPAVPFIDRVMLKGYSGPIALALLLTAILLRIWLLRNAAPLARYCSTAAVAGLLLVTLDTLLPEQLAYICPLAALARIIPGSFLYPLADIALAVSLILFSLSLCLERRFSAQWVVFLACILLPKLLLQEKLTRTRHVFDPQMSVAEEKFVISPSFPVIDALGDWILREQDRILRTEFVPSTSISVKAIASHEKLGNEAAHMFDQDRMTRWSAGRAFQQGDEWLYLRFEQPQSLSAVELAPAFFKSDFPAALRISLLEPCPENLHSATDPNLKRTELVSYSPWHGSLGYTSQNYPFYTAQKRVRAYFPKITTTQCLLVEQTGTDARVDWSVAELRLGFETSAERALQEEDLDERN
ncbi:MAG: hypothetical protein J0M12_04855 [Deltaproteobacteria bacterium]|nr:hypothetical protein [Deltaproteobacteria bacterium]